MSGDRWAEIQRVMTDVAFHRQIAGDARRSIRCHPDRVDALRARVEELGLTGTVTVEASWVVDPDQLLIFDTAALEASQRQFDQRMRNPRSEFWQRFNDGPASWTA
jgi:hypothetical protein